MIYTLENFAPDADAVVITVKDSLGNEISVTISRVIGGEVHISVAQNGTATIERGILGGEFETEIN